MFATAAASPCHSESSCSSFTSSGSYPSSSSSPPDLPDVLHVDRPAKARGAPAQARNGRPAACDICGLVLSRGDALIRHKRDKHPDTAAAMPCISCNKVFFSKSALTQHLRLGKCAVDLGPAAPPVASFAEPGSPTSSSSSPVQVSASETHSAPQGGQPASWEAPAEVRAVRISDADVDAAITEFLAWLDVPASNRDERGLKQARVKPGSSQYREAVSTLRRLFYLAESCFPSAFAKGVRLAVLVEDAVVQRIAEHLEHHRERRSKKRSRQDDDIGESAGGVKAGSRYKAYLLLKKIVVYLSGKVRQQTGVDSGPGHFSSWQRLLQLCDDANRERDADEADRLLFDDRSEDIMTRDEQHACINACSHRLQQLRAVPLHQWTLGQRRSFEAHLVTALFLVLAGPRSQILAQMKVSSTLLRPGAPGNRSPPGCYEVQIRARDTKGKKQGALLSIPAEYSNHLAFFIKAFLPEGWAGHVWLQRNHKPRTSFTDLTRLVTLSVLGRGVATHRFRHSEVSARPESDGAALAVVQGNSLDVQRQVYRVHDIREAQQRFASEMMAGGRAAHSTTGGLGL